MDAAKPGFFSKYRDYVLFNKNLIISGASAILTSALVAQLYARYDSNALANSIAAIAAEYGVYIPFFAFLFYRDNKQKYIDLLTGKRDSKKLGNDVKKLFATFSISEIIFAVTRTSAHYQLLQSGAEAYQASMIGSLIAWAVFFVCINAGVKFVRLFKKV
jgi:hypothetical protein